MCLAERDMKKFLKFINIVLIGIVFTGCAHSASILSSLANSVKKGVSKEYNKAKTKVSNKLNSEKDKIKAQVKAEKDNVTAKIDQTKSKAQALGAQVKAKGAAIKNTAESTASQLKSGGKAVLETAQTGVNSVLGAKPVESEVTEDADLDELLTEADLTELEKPESESVLPDTPTPEEAVPEPDLSSQFPPEVIAKVDPLFLDITPISDKKILDLSNQNLNDQDLEYIATCKLPILEQNKIEKIAIILSNNVFTAEGLGVFLQHLNSKMVAILDISWTTVGDAGAEALAQSLDKLPFLHSINLSNTGATGKGILELFTSMLDQKDITYQYFNASKNSIEEDYIPLILEVLGKVKEDGFIDGLDFTETGMANPEGVTLSAKIMF